MTFDNSRRIIGSRLVLFAATFPFLAFLFLSYIVKMIKFPLFGMNETIWVVSLSLIYVLIAYYPSFLKYNYIYFSDDGKSIIIRYYSTGIIKGARHSVEIPKHSFSGYARGSLIPGLIPYIILYEKRQGKIAKYPPVYLSGLKNKDRERIYKSLAVHTPAT
jgi:hypothetical protein